MPMKIETFLKSSPSFAVIFASQFITKQMTAVFKEKNLTYLQAMVLVAVFFEKSHEARPQGLAGVLHTSKGNISHCLTHLQNERLVQFDKLPSDKRGAIVRLTAKGKSVVAMLIKYFDEYQRLTEKTFTDAGTRRLMADMTQLQELYKEHQGKLK